MKNFKKSFEIYPGNLFRNLSLVLFLLLSQLYAEAQNKPVKQNKAPIFTIKKVTTGFTFMVPQNVMKDFPVNEEIEVVLYAKSGKKSIITGIATKNSSTAFSIKTAQNVDIVLNDPGLAISMKRKRPRNPGS